MAGPVRARAGHPRVVRPCPTEHEDDAPLIRTVVLPWVVLCPDNRRATLHVRDGRMRIGLSGRYRAAKAAASALASLRAGMWRDWPIPRGQDVAMRVVIYPPDRRKRDLANHAKLIADCLIGVAYDDDSQIAHVLLLRHDLDRVNPRAVVSVWPLNPGAGDET